jgi:hypothetical protein
VVCESVVSIFDFLIFIRNKQLVNDFMYFATITIYVTAREAYNRRTESKDVCFMYTASSVKQEYI